MREMSTGNMIYKANRCSVGTKTKVIGIGYLLTKILYLKKYLFCRDYWSSVPDKSLELEIDRKILAGTGGEEWQWGYD